MLVFNLKFLIAVIQYLIVLNPLFDAIRIKQKHISKHVGETVWKSAADVQDIDNHFIFHFIYLFSANQTT